MIASRLAALALTLTLSTSALAGTSLVVDASTGEVLSSENASQAWHPASTTKMMTAYLALKAVRAGKIGLETAIPASKRAASQPRVKVYIRAGQEVTLDNALRIMMVKSANDIAYVIAEGVGGDVETFIEMMNAEARRLGMNDTVFTNPNGWHDPNQQVSARDLAILAMALMREFPDYSDYWNTGAVQLGKQVLQNTNGLVGRYSGINGMKTGFVCASGFNVVATATRGGRTLIAVVLGALSGSERTVKAAQLLDDGFSRWGGAGYTLASLPSGNGGRAYNICDEVRRKGGGIALADDADSAGPIAASSAAIGGNGDNAMSERFGGPQPQGRAIGGLLIRTPSGRVVLGPRAPMAAVPVAFGRTPGSSTAPLAANATARPDTQVARDGAPVVVPGAPIAASLTTGGRTASRNGAIPRSASAFASGSEEVQPASDAFRSGPLRLQGAAQGAATASSLRPSAAAGTKQATRPPAKPAPTKPETASKAKSKPAQSEGKSQPAKSQPAKSQPARTGAAKPPARPKTKANDDA